ncbi:MAG: tetratricopeptide repeat protein [Chloroflexi bacterium]|nr:tetratricopeptide repeat protein [Chloroflexota bacterium]
MLRELGRWLGPERTRFLLALLAGGAAVSVGLQVAGRDADWRGPVQMAVLWLLMAGVALIFGSRMPAEDRGRFWLAVGPGLVLLGLGVLLPDRALFFSGAGLGWIVVAQVVLRPRVRQEYQAAIRHLRRGRLPEAIAVMDEMIAAQPDAPGHHQFRAELCRLADRLEQAVESYRQVIRLAPESAAGYLGLAEVYAQQGQYAAAREYAVQAFEYDPHDWLTAYNLGMIEDRLGAAEPAIVHLEQASQLGLPHSRYRLLTRLWLARNHYRQGQLKSAQAQLDLLRKEQSGWQDWQLILESEQAAPLRRMVQADVDLAGRLLAPDAPLSWVAEAASVPETFD